MTDHMGPLVSDPEMIWFMRPHEAAYHIRYPEADPLDPITEVDGRSAAANGSDARSNLTRSPFKPKRYTRRSLSRRFSLKGKGTRPKRQRNGESHGICNIMWTLIELKTEPFYTVLNSYLYGHLVFLFRPSSWDCEQSAIGQAAPTAYRKLIEPVWSLLIIMQFEHSDS